MSIFINEKYKIETAKIPNNHGKGKGDNILAA